MRRGLVPSRERAREEIAAGRVTVSGSAAVKPATLVAGHAPLAVQGPPARFVSRGGLKLDAALDRFAVTVAGASALDAGASTGGFTDCLLQRGAARVVAVDVGRGQLHQRLAGDPRVRVLDRTNVRHLDAAALDLPGPLDLVVADLAFISLRTVAPALTGLVRTGGDLVVLVKPQFEAGRAEVSRGRGVVRDPSVWATVVEHALAAFADVGAAIMDVMVSPLRGAEGNVEFLAHLVRGPRTGVPPYDALITAAVHDAAGLGSR